MEGSRSVQMMCSHPHLSSIDVIKAVFAQLIYAGDGRSPYTGHVWCKPGFLLPPLPSTAELNPGLTDGTSSSLGFMLVKIPLQGEILQGKSPAIVLCKVQLVNHRVFSRWFVFIIFCFILQLSAWHFPWAFVLGP